MAAGSTPNSEAAWKISFLWERTSKQQEVRDAGCAQVAGQEHERNQVERRQACEEPQPGIGLTVSERGRTVRRRTRVHGRVLDAVQNHARHCRHQERPTSGLDVSGHSPRRSCQAHRPDQDQHRPRECMKRNPTPDFRLVPGQPIFQDDQLDDGVQQPVHDLAGQAKRPRPRLMHDEVHKDDEEEQVPAIGSGQPHQEAVGEKYPGEDGRNRLHLPNPPTTQLPNARVSPPWAAAPGRSTPRRSSRRRGWAAGRPCSAPSSSCESAPRSRDG